ncbi:MAG: 1-acyl-sn-glycerol-3-phosphate acyltransferase [Bacteroidota bacterium]|nr:1-acyl-sn-glycerol-3-phosphate acyltransferase [Bacteroidota bacterium]
MKLRKVEKWSLGYALLKAWVGFWHNNIFYKKIVIINKENIPDNAHLIFAINHQNALMDPLAVIYALKKMQLVFLARSDIFKKSFTARILMFIKILPIYRIRDGFDSLKNNDEVFLKTAEVIRSKRGLAILPEGSHEGIHRLRQLKKGFARIVFQTEEANNFDLDIKIIPVGLDYSDYENFRTTLLVNFGKPISVSDYYDRYKESPVKGYNQLKDELWNKLKLLMVHIESEEYYHLNNELREIYKNKMAKHLSLPNSHQPNKLKTDQALINILSKCEADKPSLLFSLWESVINYNKKLKSMKLTTGMVEKGSVSIGRLILSTAFLLISLPVFLYGFINNYVPYWIPTKISRKVKDQQFHSSFKFGLSRIIFPIFHIIQTFLVLLISSSWLVAGIYILSLLPSALFAWWWFERVGKLADCWKLRKLSTNKASGFAEVRDLLKEIIEKTDEIVKKYMPGS